LPNALAWLTTTTTPAELPVVPHLASERLPSLTLVLQNTAAPNASRFVLQLWAVDMELTDGSPLPIWVGSVVEEHLNRPLSLLSVALTLPDINTPRDVLANELQSGRLTFRTGAAVDADWDGRVLLLRQTTAVN
jgi:undecaprenyl-diphosphatase